MIMPTALMLMGKLRKINTETEVHSANVSVLAQVGDMLPHVVISEVVTCNIYTEVSTCCTFNFSLRSDEGNDWEALTAWLTAVLFTGLQSDRSVALLPAAAPTAAADDGDAVVSNSEAGESGELRHVWMSALPFSLVIIGCSLRVANVYTCPVSLATSSITSVPVRTVSS